MEDIAGHYMRNGGEFLVGLVLEEIVAMGALRRIDARCGEIKRLRVHPARQRSGFGQAILSSLEQRARALGFQELVLDTTSRQHAAQELFRKNGYIEVRRAAGRRFDLLFLRKDLRN